MFLTCCSPRSVYASGRAFARNREPRLRSRYHPALPTLQTCSDVTRPPAGPCPGPPHRRRGPRSGTEGGDPPALRRPPRPGSPERQRRTGQHLLRSGTRPARCRQRCLRPYRHALRMSASMTSRAVARARNVPASSWLIRREYPATSAAKMAAKRRSTRGSCWAGTVHPFRGAISCGGRGAGFKVSEGFASIRRCLPFSCRGVP